MKCCEYCFTDNYLREIIQKKGMIGNCDYCGRKNIFCINPEELKQYFSPIVNLYTRVDEFMPMEVVKEMENGKFIWELLCDDWDIFDNYDIAKEILSEMFICNFENGSEEPELYLDSWYENEKRYYGTENDISNLLINEWDKFDKEMGVFHRLNSFSVLYYRMDSL